MNLHRRNVISYANTKSTLLAHLDDIYAVMETIREAVLDSVMLLDGCLCSVSQNFRLRSYNEVKSTESFACSQ